MLKMILVLILIEVCEVWWWSSFVLFWTKNTLFRHKIKIVRLRWNLVSRIIQAYWTRWCSFVLFCTENILLENKIKIVRLRWNLGSRLIQIYWNLWWGSFVLFWTGNTFLGEINQQKSKLLKMKVSV